jgi:hypothetical protein
LKNRRSRGSALGKSLGATEGDKELIKIDLIKAYGRNNDQFMCGLAMDYILQA